MDTECRYEQVDLMKWSVGWYAVLLMKQLLSEGRSYLFTAMGHDGASGSGAGSDFTLLGLSSELRGKQTG